MPGKTAHGHDSTGGSDGGAPDPTAATRVDRADLLHLAELEAHGVIEPVEEARLQKLFDAAQPSLQAEVRALQESIAVDPTLRSSEHPPESLRLRTLARVAQAIEEESAAAAPIATIGPKSAGSRDQSSVRDAVSADAARWIIEGIARERDRLRTVRQPYWRAAAFFLLAALSVSVYFNWSYVAVSEKLAKFAIAEVVDSEMREIASSIAGFDFGRARHVDLMRMHESGKGHVEIFTDPDSGRVAVLGVGFEIGDALEVVIRDPEGGVPYTHQFRVTASGFGKICEVPAAMARAGIVEIRDGSGVTLFKA